MEVSGYDLLFRAADEGWADVANPNEATASTIVTTFGDIGLDRVVRAVRAGHAAAAIVVTRHGADPPTTSDLPA